MLGGGFAAPPQPTTTSTFTNSYGFVGGRSGAKLLLPTNNYPELIVLLVNIGCLLWVGKEGAKLRFLPSTPTIIQYLLVTRYPGEESGGRSEAPLPPLKSPGLRVTNLCW